MQQVRSSGILQLEMACRSKELHGHLYSVQLLATISSLAASNDVDL